MKQEPGLFIGMRTPGTITNNGNICYKGRVSCAPDTLSEQSQDRWRCSYAKDALTKTADILSRTLSIAINIHMDEQIPRIVKALEKAARVIED